MPIMLNKNEWARIVKWTDSDREEPDAARKREYVKFLDNASRAMTKTWPNSLENVNKRNEELRRARLEAAEQANTKFYKKYLKRQREEQERLMYSARDIVFRNKDAPKLLLSAVIETVIQKERIEQLKFLEEQRRVEAENKKKDDDEIIQKAKEWNQLMETKQRRRFEANKLHQKEILEQAHEVSERKRIEYETELNLQKKDNVKANQEMDAIKEFEDNFKAAEKKRIWSDMERARLENEQRKKEQQARTHTDERLMQVLLRSRANVEKRRKQAEVDMKNEKLRVLEAISLKLESGDAAREAKEQAILDKAIAEKDAIAEERSRKQQKMQQQLRLDRKASRDKWLQDEAQRLQDFNTMRQWQIMNRFKNAKIYDDFKEKLRKEKERKVAEYRAEILRLWREREDREARSRAETRHFYGPAAQQRTRQEDNRLLSHAAALLREARDHGRPERPLRRAIDQYCKMHRLFPMPDLPASLREHFGKYAPWDGSEPDPWYREPPPPPPRSQPDEDGALDSRRDGLQEPGPSKSEPVKKDKLEDFKRAAPANGLQQRPAKENITLPPIDVVPCKTADCHCELKKSGMK